MTPYPIDPTVTVERIEIIKVGMPFSAGRRGAGGTETIDRFNGSSSAFTTMESLMVKVIASNGLVGWGEAFGHATNAVTETALTQLLAPFYLGQLLDPAGVSVAAQRAFHAFGRTGPLMYALSALDTALWDLAAQQANVPLRTLLAAALVEASNTEASNTRAANTEATPARDTVRAYASLVHYSEDPVEVRHHLSRAQAEGYTSFKLHESTAEAIGAARQQVGQDAPLMVDVNCRWPGEEAVNAARNFAPFNLMWLEEPVWPPDDDVSLAAVEAAGMPVAVGENASGPVDLIKTINSGAVSFIQPSVGKIGGLTAMIAVAAAADAAGVALHPHCFYYGPALTATAQFSAARQTAIDLEIPYLQWPEKLHELHGVGPDMNLPATPGLGFRPNLDTMARYTLASHSIFV